MCSTAPAAGPVVEVGSQTLGEGEHKLSHRDVGEDVSTIWAAVSSTGRAPQDGQEPRRRQEYARMSHFQPALTV